MPNWLTHWIDRFYLRRRRKEKTFEPKSIRDQLQTIATIQNYEKKHLGDIHIENHEQIKNEHSLSSLENTPRFRCLSSSLRSRGTPLACQTSGRRSCIPTNKTYCQKNRSLSLRQKTRSRKRTTETPLMKTYSSDNQRVLIHITPGGEVMPLERHLSEVCEAEKIDSKQAPFILYHPPIELHRSSEENNGSLLSSAEFNPTTKRMLARTHVAKISQDCFVTDSTVESVRLNEPQRGQSKQTRLINKRYSFSTPRDVESLESNHPEIVIDPPTADKQTSDGQEFSSNGINNQAVIKHGKRDRGKKKGRLSPGRRKRKNIPRQTKPSINECDCPCAQGQPKVTVVDSAQQTVSPTPSHHSASTTMRHASGLIEQLIDRVTWDMADAILARANFAKSLSRRSSGGTKIMLRRLLESRHNRSDRIGGDLGGFVSLINLTDD